MKPDISDEILHAFVDGELDVDDSEKLIVRMRENAELTQRVCALRSLQNMVWLAYAEPPVAAGGPSRVAPQRPLMQRCGLGCLLLLAGLSGGWALRSMESPTVASVPPPVIGGYQAVSLTREADPNRVMLHLDSAAPERMQAALDQAERLLDEADRQGRAMQLAIVANSQGINLMRVGVSPHAERIARLTQRHANIHWVACSQTIARFTREGQHVELLPTARAAPTAIGEIVTRLQQGWTYVRI